MFSISNGEAIWHLVGALGLTLRSISTRIRSRRAALTQERRRTFFLRRRETIFLQRRGTRILLEDGDRGHVVGSGNVTVVIPDRDSLEPDELDPFELEHRVLRCDGGKVRV